MTTCAEYTTQLAAAEAALSTTLLGGQVVEVRTSSDKVLKFAPGNVGDRYAHIRWLQGKVDACNGVTRANRVLRFVPSDG